MDNEERENKEDALRSLLDDEDFDASDLDEEDLDALMSKIINIDNINESIDKVIEVMRLQRAKENDIEEALSVNLHMHMNEAKEVLKEKRLSEATNE